ncbi:MAG: Ig-like domain-containing protein [Rikenellaceae bacterium]|jgi:hypothetical protein|nr:Ig-like domain-containing protein [Rikenellaceae bacterium]
MKKLLLLALFGLLVFSCEKDKDIAVTGVTLNEVTLELIEGESETLIAIIAPENATNKEVEWSSSDAEVVSVDDAGEVTALKAGTATITVVTADGAKTATCTVTVITENDDNQLYESTDYSEDEDVTVLQEATEGAGIDIVLLGDGYSDRQIAAGDYEDDMETIYNNLFTEEPYRSFKNLFNVYSVTVVSKNEGYLGETALGGWLEGGESTLVGGDDAACFEYALNAVDDSRMDNTLIVVSMNAPVYAGTCYMYPPTLATDYSSGVSVAYFPKDSDVTGFAQLLHHEACGHGFAKLGDEYVSSSDAIPAAEMEATRTQQTDWGWWKNVDFTGNLSTIRWHYFLGDPRYADQGLGAFEGGYTYEKGIWRPTENSIMRYNTGGFNAPSREAIYYRIHKLAYGASWTYDYETFAAWDLALFSVSTRATDAGAGTGTGAGVLKPLPHTPPVVLPYSWRDAR